MASRLSRFLNALWNRAGVVIVSNHIPCQITSIYQSEQEKPTRVDMFAMRGKPHVERRVRGPNRPRAWLRSETRSSLYLSPSF